MQNVAVRACVLGSLIACGFSQVVTADVSARDRVSAPFLGVRHIERVVSGPRPLYMNVLEIDLTAPGLSFRLTPEVPGLANGDETITQTTRQFVEEQGAQLGINANFFRLEHHSQARPTNNTSLAASDGNAYSPWSFNAPFGFNISEDNVATFIEVVRNASTVSSPNVDLYNAFSGNFQIVTDGRAATTADIPRDPGTGYMRDVNPRTAVGLTQDNKLLLVTVDGRQPVFSEGVYLDELGAILKDFGAVQAINLDGGGSTTMVADYYGDTASDGADRGTRLVNSATGRGSVGSERYNGINLAVFAAPNPNYAPRQAPPPPPDHVAILADFEQDEGTFTSGAISGSNRNIMRATVERITNDAYSGDSAQRLAIDAGSGSGMALRNLSGGGSPGNNTAFASTGSIGFFVKVLTPGLDDGDVLASIIIDDGSAHEIAVGRAIATDGEWHLVEWDLDNAGEWSSFASGNGVIDAAQVTIDAIHISSETNLDVIVYWDLLAHNPEGSLSVLIPEPSAAAALLSIMLLARRTR